jgi:hypothetical protein
MEAFIAEHSTNDLFSSDQVFYLIGSCDTIYRYLILPCISKVILLLNETTSKLQKFILIYTSEKQLLSDTNSESRSM